MRRDAKTGEAHRRAHHTALMLLVLLLVHLSSGNAALTLRLVQVAHRHGSRTPDVGYNQSQICGDVPCAYLNVPGQTMTVNAGDFLRRHYNSDASNPFFPTESYDLDVSYTRSSDVARAIQSAEGILRGLFPNMTAFFPAVHTVEPSTDWLLRNEIIPYARIFYRFDREWELEVCNPKVDTIIDFPTLQTIAREVYSEGYCADMENRCRCAQTLFDIGNAMAADGRIVNFPSLSANLEKLRSFTAFYFGAEFGYNASNELHRRMGSHGQVLAQQILANAQLHMQGKSAYKLYHYSAHDTTLSSQAGTLGDTTPTGALPPFAQLYAFELLYDDEANAYSMRVMRGSPGQTPETNYEFAWDDFTLKCMDSNGAVYEAANNTCPFYDFQRFVDSSKPTDPAGLCYLDDRYKSLLNCPAKDGEVDSSECRNYRALCPAWACDADSMLDLVTLQCKCSAASCMGVSGGGSGGASNAADNRGPTVSAGAAAGIAIATFAVGVILAVCVVVVVWVFRGGKNLTGS